MIDALNRRARAMLRAVSEGRAEMTRSCEADLRIDGCGVCDQFTAHALADDGLIRPVLRLPIGQWSRAELTTRGRAVLTGPTSNLTRGELAS